jgi:hypothetical protein
MGERGNRRGREIARESADYAELQPGEVVDAVDQKQIRDFRVISRIVLLSLEKQRPTNRHHEKDVELHLVSTEVN